jgi:hypothetical protein
LLQRCISQFHTIALVYVSAIFSRWMNFIRRREVQQLVELEKPG